MRVAVLGLGEAGSIYAADLAARGAPLSGPTRTSEAPADVARRRHREAVRPADVVLSLVGEFGGGRPRRGAPGDGGRGIFADIDTCGPE